MEPEKVYYTKELILNLANALENGYKELGETDIADLLLLSEKSAQQTLAADEATLCLHNWSYPPDYCPVCNKRIPIVRLAAKA